MGDNQIASNSLDYLHNEDYGASFDSHPLTRETMVFMGGREGESLVPGPGCFECQDITSSKLVGLRRFFEHGARVQRQRVVPDHQIT